MDTFGFTSSDIGDLALYMGICWAIGSAYLSKLFLNYFSSLLILEGCLCLFTVLSFSLLFPESRLYCFGDCRILRHDRRLGLASLHQPDFEPCAEERPRKDFGAKPIDSIACNDARPLDRRYGLPRLSPVSLFNGRPFWIYRNHCLFHSQRTG